MSWVPGIDVSHHQGTVDWPAVARAGIRFVWIKSSQGTSMTDDRFPQNKAGAAAAGIMWGAYHFGGAKDPIAEARWFVDQGVIGGGMPPCLDLEAPGMDANWALRFLIEVERLTKVRPIFYGNASYVGSSPLLAQYPLWLPRYPTSAVDPDPTRIKRAVTVGAWSRWVVWQYTSTGRVAGIAGNVDRNVAESDWFDSLGQSPPPYRPETAPADLTPPPPEDDMQVQFMRGKSHAEVYEVSADLLRCSHVQDIAARVYALRVRGVEVLPAPAGTEKEPQGGIDVWVVSDDFIAEVTG